MTQARRSRTGAGGGGRVLCVLLSFVGVLKVLPVRFFDFSKMGAVCGIGERGKTVFCSTTSQGLEQNKKYLLFYEVSGMILHNADRS